MKYIIAILLILMTVSCSEITVLEVTLVDSTPRNLYKVSYKVDELLKPPYVDKEYFYSTVGVDNFLTEVADKDYSQWRLK